MFLKAKASTNMFFLLKTHFQIGKRFKVSRPLVLNPTIRFRNCVCGSYATSLCKTKANFITSGL